MTELADIYGLDREMTQTAGLLHDAGKGLASISGNGPIDTGGFHP